MSAIPVLFLMALDWVTTEAYGLSDKCMRWQLVRTLEDLEFADDIHVALLTNRLRDMHCKMEDLKIKAAVEKVVLQIENVPKTQMMKRDDKARWHS